MKKTILITGASGFVGQSFLTFKGCINFKLKTLSLRNLNIEELQLDSVSSILYFTGLAHQMDAIDENEYYKINHELTLQFAKHAKKEGVKHFVFLSSSKVYGDRVNSDFIYNEDSICQPTDHYGRSKLLAEQDLMKLSSPEFIISIIRPPLIYGPGVKGNLNKIIKLSLTFPILPLNRIENRRSMVYVQNLNALICHLIDNPVQGIFIAKDRNDYSTSDLCHEILKCTNHKVFLFKLPKIFVSVFRIIQPKLISRLFDSYLLDNEKTKSILNFNVPFSFEDGVKSMVEQYLISNED